MSLSQEEHDMIALAARVSSAFSVLGVFTIFGVFSFARAFRSPIHRIIFYAAFCDLIGCVGTMISVSGPDAGDTSSLCQFQGFVLQVFPLADVLWTLAMALDVYLAVFHQFDGRALQQCEIKYVMAIAVFTFIPALIFLFIHTPARGPMYAGVIIWCSISSKWTLVRLLLFYVPIWYGPSFKTTFPSIDRSTLTTMNRLTIAVIIIIYGIVGIKIWVVRSDIKLTSDDYGSLSSASTSSQPSDRIVSTGTTNTLTTTVEPQSLNEAINAPNPQQITIQLGIERTSTPRPPSHMQSEPPRQRSLSLRQYIIIPSLFFLVLLSTWIPPTIFRVRSFYHPAYASYSLLLATAILSSLRGFWNAVIFITMGVKGRRRHT
ncbi:uncharacterized protein N7477_008919 [Penicillium maclennaniae]|uniref:uncharacterized protein n=1 Tax=Penicillium maclennaniae TaxID=1343394 RepID=UPI00253F8AD7|nr:uncharacterized protein N7477_008919 [Penicillium maclennaniae]KAJ5666471.1 hypothetical protein N7477_008919 [Penicillium maclennaniae]